jgi:predicted short-subunit dehydrogenase-like oxidoreductase (DUF2520 family)
MGRGNLGRSLARAFRLAGHRVLLTPGHRGVPALGRALRSRPRAVVFLTVPDGAIESLAGEIANSDGQQRAAAFAHCSGALGLGVLDALAGGHAVGSFHPLQSFPEPRPAEAFRGSLVAIDASTDALRRRLQRLARDVGAKPRDVREAERVVYHAAAVFASNYLVALAGQAVELLQSIGWTEREAVTGLVPLMQGALAEVERRGPTAATSRPSAATWRLSPDSIRAPVEVGGARRTFIVCSAGPRSRSRRRRASMPPRQSESTGR